MIVIGFVSVTHAPPPPTHTHLSSSEEHIPAESFGGEGKAKDPEIVTVDAAAHLLSAAERGPRRSQSMGAPTPPPPPSSILNPPPPPLTLFPESTRGKISGGNKFV